MPIINFSTFSPTVNSSVFVAPDAWVIGKTSIKEFSSVFFGAVLRGDVQPITVGSRTNIQDHAILHSSNGRGPCIVGDDVTIGHRAIIHGCKIGNRCIIGMGAIILDDSEIGDDCIIGANTLVTAKTVIPPKSMVMGSPGIIKRTLTDLEIGNIISSAEGYVKISRQYLG